jgi:hypothetical protein
MEETHSGKKYIEYYYSVTRAVKCPLTVFNFGQTNNLLFSAINEDIQTTIHN